MSTVLDAPVMTTAELLALPRNGKERWLVAGQLREKPMTVRNRVHSRIMVRSSHLLESWRELQSQPRGLVLCGEAGCRLGRNPDTTVGIDVVYVAASLVTQESDETTLIDGVPTLVIEILSPSDTVEEIKEKIDLYQKFRVPLVWVIDPHERGRNPRSEALARADDRRHVWPRADGQRSDDDRGVLLYRQPAHGGQALCASVARPLGNREQLALAIGCKLPRGCKPY